MLDVWQGETLDWPFLVQGGWGQCCGGGGHVQQILPVTQGGDRRWQLWGGAIDTQWILGGWRLGHHHVK